MCSAATCTQSTRVGRQLAAFRQYASEPTPQAGTGLARCMMHGRAATPDSDIHARIASIRCPAAQHKLQTETRASRCIMAGRHESRCSSTQTSEGCSPHLDAVRARPEHGGVQALGRRVQGVRVDGERVGSRGVRRQRLQQRRLRGALPAPPPVAPAAALRQAPQSRVSDNGRITRCGWDGQRVVTVLSCQRGARRR